MTRLIGAIGGLLAAWMVLEFARHREERCRRDQQPRPAPPYLCEPSRYVH